MVAAHLKRMALPKSFIHHMDTYEAKSRLHAIAKRLSAGESVETVTVREFLSWFGVKRRGVWVVEEIRSVLKAEKLITEPDFESTYIDGPIQVRSEMPSLAEVTTDELALTGSATAISSSTGMLIVAAERIDPTHRISKLAAANNVPVSVTPDSPISEALTIMLAHGFSQLPVMTSPREIKGVVSWQSIGARLGMGKTAERARDVMESHHEVRYDSSIFQVIPLIVANDYVLVRGTANIVTGIVTASDLSLQFLQLSEPFLLLSEIENQIREFIAHRFTVNDLAANKDPKDPTRSIEHVSDLTFGEYIRLLENPDNWTKSGIPLDRVVFCAKLGAVRDIRNDVMHFDPDGISPADLETLREFARFLQKLSAMGVA